MSFRRVTAYACIALATGWGFFPTSAHACGLFNWLWGDNSTTAYYAPVNTAFMPNACATPVVAQRPVVTWMPVTNYATTVQSVPVTSYRPSLFGGVFGCNWQANQVNRAPVTAWMPGTLATSCPAQTCPTACQMPSLPVETVYSQPAACCPTTTMMPSTTSCCPSTSYSPPVTTYSVPSGSSCGCSSSSATTSYSVPTTTTTIVPSSGCSCGGSSCSCGSHASTGAAVGTGVLAGSSSYPTSTYSSGSSYPTGTSNYSSGNAIVADTPPALGSTDSPRIDGNSLGLPETSYSANYGGSSLSLSAPTVQGQSAVTPGPIRAESNVEFGVPTIRPLDSSSLPSNIHSAAMQPTTDNSNFGVAPMRDPEARDRDGRLLAPPLLDPRAKTAELSQPTIRNAVALDDRIPVMPASLTVETPAAFAPAAASFASQAPAIETTGLRPIDDAPVAYSAAKVAVDYPTSNAGFAPAPASTGSYATQLSESLWQSARP